MHLNIFICFIFTQLRDSITEFPHDYKMEGHEGHFDNIGHHNLPHSSSEFLNDTKNIRKSINHLNALFLN